MCSSPRILSAFVCLFLLALQLLASPSQVLAQDGSGTAIVDPDSAAAGSTANDFTFTYTAEEDMGDGAVLWTAPDPWPDPNPGNTTVTVVNGLTGEVIDSLDANPPTGWQDDFVGVLAPLCGLLGVLCDLDLSTSSSDPFAGSGNLHADFGLANIAVLGASRIYFNFGAAQDWSGYTHLSFYTRADGLALANLISGGTLQISESTSLGGSPASYPLSSFILNLSLLQNGEWTQVIVDLTSAATSTRNAVRSYGFVFDDLVGLSVTGDIEFDHIMAGPADPIFSGNTVTQNLLFLDDGGTVTFDYENVTAPAAPGTYTFTTQQKVDSSGTLTSIDVSPTIDVLIETNCNNDADEDGDNLIDCADGDCTASPFCNPETNCNDNVDNDGDGNEDCEDTDCTSNPACIESNCTNGLDDDEDGETDCVDDDCNGNPACLPETNCTNHLDDDSDGEIDCADSDCVTNPACVETNCVNGLDDDGDGDVDCADTNCADTPACPDSETSCNNEIDDDRDGPVDCADSDCASNPACTNPDDDDDGDGVPNDDDNCVTVPNPDQADRDGDGIGDACDNIIDQDIDEDGGKEQAHDQNNDQCFGDLFFDPDGSSDDCIRADGNNDQCADFFVDTNGDGCVDHCPELYWNPSDGVLDDVSERPLDVDGDGDDEIVCAYDSDGDGEDDSFVETTPGGPAVGGEGGGGANPFALSGSGCSLTAAGPALPWASFGLLGLAFLGLRGRSRR